MNFLSLILAIIAGGVGAGLRYSATVFAPAKKEGFPVAIFVVNAVGSLLVGLFAALLANALVSPEVVFVLVAGFCGGLTTMSTFAVDSIERLRAGHWMVAGLNIVGSTAVGLLAVGAGYLLGGGPLS
ncbi:CrcB protein [Aurantimicrobium minutum]|uniref:fluoride efflux transporter FluC n=1 Tax=Aurantimicrobium minutum TaxID=708131 RepID=UPI002475D3F6|nr:CrcB family protein [Aurantimicrobium minutum]MDH6409781.1 CrcB protein [Aurantimicrobium minutum]MDH6423988.1 CrcB protein [Aurantimicrobium minutum]